jgi:CubicO group peptidase (beta-lactamase class C family)
MKIQQTLIILLLQAMSISLFSQTKKSTDNKRTLDFDQYAIKGMQAWNIPGMAVGVIKDGQVLFIKGYGVKSVEKPEPVDLHTRFSIGSTTKAMTAVCMGMLVDEGKVRWDDPVIQHLPEFKLHDAYATRSLRIRDLFTHNSGVGNADFLWGSMKISPAEIVQKLGEVPPSYPLRGGYTYQNIFYLVAGQVIERIYGKPWTTVMQERIFRPLGMTHSTPTLRDADPSNLSSAHYPKNGKATTIRRSVADAVGPAGSVYACIEDFSRWALVMLDSSKYLGGRLLKPATWTELFTPQITIPVSQFYPTMSILKPSWTTYGLGWFQHDYKGRKVNYHTGSLAGEIAMHAQLPSEKLGVVFLGNMDHAELRHSLVYKAFDLFALGGDRDWDAEFRQLYSGLNAGAEQAQKRKHEMRITGTTPDHEAVSLTGVFENQLLGKVTVTYERGLIKINLNDVVYGTAEHFHYNTYLLRYDDWWLDPGFITFRTNEAGKISSIETGGIQFIKKNE